MRRRRPSATALLVVAVLVLVALRVPEPWSTASSGDTGPGPWGAPAAQTPGDLELGVTTLALARNSWRPWTPADLVEVDRFEHDARRHADIVMWFADWESARFDVAQARAVLARGSTPAIAWEPWDAAKSTSEQPEYQLRTIVDGEHDATIRRWARAIADYGGPLRLRFAHEMNGEAYPWAERANGNRPGEYVRAWRHVRRIFLAEGATNVTWEWCPVAAHIDPGLFPGESAVDVVAVSGFNGGSAVFRRQWRSFRAAFAHPLRRIHELAPSTPVAVSEVASAEEGGDKGRWITEMFDEVRRRPEITSLTWFHVDKEADWRITSSEDARTAFARGLREARRRPAAFGPRSELGSMRSGR